MDGPLWELVKAGTLAPSGDNTQPWRFAVDPAAGRIVLFVDESRDPSPMNAGQRMARIAVGAALENILRTAEASGWPASAEVAQAPALAAVRLEGSPPAGVRVPEPITARVTNRRIYDGGSAPSEVLAGLCRGARALPGVTVHCVTDPPQLRALARLVGRADALMFAEPSMRRAFLANVRFGEPPNAEVATGLSLGSLELTRSERFGLQMMRRLPGWALACGGAFKALGSRARRAVESSSGMCLITASDSKVGTDLTVGRAMQSAWLALTERGLAVQPMMSLPVLSNVLEQGPPGVRSSLARRGVAELLAEVSGVAPASAGTRVAALFRFGRAAPPSHRVGRLPVCPVGPGP
jgi:hypothetical protein